MIYHKPVKPFFSTSTRTIDISSTTKSKIEHIMNSKGRPYLVDTGAQSDHACALELADLVRKADLGRRARPSLEDFKCEEPYYSLQYIFVYLEAWAPGKVFFRAVSARALSCSA